MPGRGGTHRVPLPRRAAAVPLAVLAVLGVLALIGWQSGWPSAVFGTKLASSTASPPRPSAVQAAVSPSQHAPASTAPASAAPASSAPGSAAPSSASPASSASPGSSPGGVTGPAATVQAYFAAINRGAYRAAWRLGGKNFSSSYQAFVNGLAGTAEDTVTIISVNGDTVTAQLAARQADGSIKTYQGTYTVIAGVIASSSVQQTG